MSIQLSLCCPTGSRLPLNYQYELSSWIYKTLAQFAAWLHEHGYSVEGKKRFKFFTFSHLHLKSPFEIDSKGQAIQLHSGKADLTLSFLLDKTLEHFITGLFRQQRFGIGNARMRPVDFTVESVRVMSPPVFESVMRFRALSPICVAAHEEGNPHPQYRHPNDPDYAKLLFSNLREKRQAANHYAQAAATPLPEDTIEHFCLLSEPASKALRSKQTRRNQPR
jgi:CRISPR-associated endoribonuclease Cas6